MAIAGATLWVSTIPSGGGSVDSETISITIVSERDIATRVAASTGSEPSAARQIGEQAPTKETFNDNRYGFCGRGLTV